jgi:hypothetical protein
VLLSRALSRVPIGYRPTYQQFGVTKLKARKLFYSSGAKKTIHLPRFTKIFIHPHVDTTRLHGFAQRFYSSANIRRKG